MRSSSLDLNADGTALRVRVELNQGQGLSGERGAHDIARVTRAAGQIQQPALGPENDAYAVRKDDVIHPRLDVFPGVLPERGAVDFPSIAAWSAQIESISLTHACAQRAPRGLKGTQWERQKRGCAMPCD